MGWGIMNLTRLEAAAGIFLKGVKVGKILKADPLPFSNPISQVPVSFHLKLNMENKLVFSFGT